MKVKLLCYIKIESYLALCEGVCQTALKTTYCKLEFTKLTKCLRGSYDEPLKERALSDNSGNFEQKCCKCVSFFCVSLRVREDWHLVSVPEHFPAAAGRCIPCMTMRLSTILLWHSGWCWPGATAPCAEVSAASNRAGLPPIPLPPHSTGACLYLFFQLCISDLWQMLSPACV